MVFRPVAPSNRSSLFKRLAFAGVALLLLFGCVYLVKRWATQEAFSINETAVPVLDPARVWVLRTPGGALEVATLKKAEKFAWRSSYACPLVDCASLLGKTTSEVELSAHFTYRIPLSGTWTLTRNGERYDLVVPSLQPKTPVAFDTKGMRLRTDKDSWLSPPAAPNREKVVLELGPVLNQRAVAADYIHLAEQGAKLTVAEFARKWMLEQHGQKPDLPIQVTFVRVKDEVPR